MGRLVLRSYRRGDQDAVAELHRQGLAQVGLHPGDGVYYDDDLPHIEEIYLRQGGEFLVGELDGEIVAMGALRRVDAQAAELVRLRVHPAMQGRGYGRQLAEALEQRAVELGCAVLRGDTTVGQVAAIGLYQALGWRETGRAVIGGIENIYGEKWLIPKPELLDLKSATFCRA
jgi:GNAT superfamily N-acetyltransferase